LCLDEAARPVNPSNIIIFLLRLPFFSFFCLFPFWVQLVVLKFKEEKVQFISVFSFSFSLCGCLITSGSALSGFVRDCTEEER
jgi:hypothetical protein